MYMTNRTVIMHILIYLSISKYRLTDFRRLVLCKPFFIVISVLSNSIFFMLLYDLSFVFLGSDFDNSATSPHWWTWQIFLLGKRNKIICLKENAGLCYLSLYNRDHSWAQKTKCSIVLLCYIFSHSHHVLTIIVLRLK